MANAYPLEWPTGWKRTRSQDRVNGKFSQLMGSSYGNQRKIPVTVFEGCRRIIDALEKMGASNLVISTNVTLKLNGQPRSNQAEPDDRGAAIYWSQGRGPQRCMAIDRYYTVADNLAAIAATLEAMRAIERHGGAEILDRSFSGFAALPAKASQAWRDVLGIPSAASFTPAMIEQRFRALVLEHHPDKGGDRERFEAIVQAREDALKESGIDQETAQ